MMGSARVSVMRTEQASARLMGTSEYFSRSLKTGSILRARSKAMTRARRRRSALRLGAPLAPSRCDASDKAASQVDHGGGWLRACVTAHSWWKSRPASHATRNPVSTMTFLAIACGAQILLFVCGQVGWQAFHGTG